MRKEIICNAVEIRDECDSEELLGTGGDSRDAYADREVGVGPLTVEESGGLWLVEGEMCDGWR